MYKHFKAIGNTDRISEWKSKGLSDESIEPPNTSDNSLAPLGYFGNKNKCKIWWKLFKTRQNYIYSWKSSKHIHCLWNYEIMKIFCGTL